MKDEKIKELLKIPDLPEEEQRKKIAEYITPKPWEHFIPAGFTPSHGNDRCSKCGKICRTWQKIESECSTVFPYSGSFADLAFRLRDEAQKNVVNWDKAIHIVHNRTKEKFYNNVFAWMVEEAKPIHFIVASLIAKALAEEVKDRKEKK